MNLVKPPYICQGLWEKMSYDEKTYWCKLPDEKQEIKMTDVDKAADIILHAEPEALQHVLKTHPYLGEKLISRLQGALKKKELEEPDQVYIQFGKHDSTISTWRSLEEYNTWVNLNPPYINEYTLPIKFISEKKIDRIVKDKLTSILTSILKKVNDE